MIVYNQTTGREHYRIVLPRDYGRYAAILGEQGAKVIRFDQNQRRCVVAHPDDDKLHRIMERICFCNCINDGKAGQIKTNKKTGQRTLNGKKARCRFHQFEEQLS